MATKKPTVQRVADLKSRFVRIKAAVMTVDTLTADYLDRVASDLEAFSVDMAALTGRDDDQPAAN